MNVFSSIREYSWVFKQHYYMHLNNTIVPLGCYAMDHDFYNLDLTKTKLIVSQFTNANRTLEQIPPKFDFVEYFDLEYNAGFDRSPMKRYLQNMASAKYCLSPHGHTPDCYRHWEAMYVNCIPVTIKHKYLEPFYDMPILFLDSWDQLTEKLLIDSYDELSKRSRDKLNIEYWLDMLENKGN